MSGNRLLSFSPFLVKPLLQSLFFFLCFVVWHLPPSPVQHHYAGGDPLLVPLLSAGSAAGISRMKE